MTVPIERTHAIRNTEDFLYSLMDPRQTPRVPKAIRLRARRLLKHYPSSFYLEQLARKAPDVLGTPRKRD